MLEYILNNKIKTIKINKIILYTYSFNLEHFMELAEM